MAIIALKVPHETGRLLEGVEVPGDRKSSSDMHVTILYLGKGIPVENVAQAMVACYSITSNTNPFMCGMNMVSSFPANPDDGIPIICPVQSPALHKLRDNIMSKFDESGIQYDTKFPEYKPHVSLAFCKDEMMDSYSSPLSSPLTWTASELTIWGGDKNDEVLCVSLPFVLGSVDRVARRIVELI